MNRIGLKTIVLSKEIPLCEYRGAFVFPERFEEACSRCPGYGGCWACPPYGFDVREIWSSYDSILLYAKKAVIPSELTERIYAPEELKAVYEELLAPVEEELVTELRRMEAGTPGSLMLTSGGCLLCGTCARLEGAPCRYPDKLRYSIESIGGDVVGSLRSYFGEKVLWAVNGRLPEYFILLGGLLKKYQ